jgi:hypothetical protein
MPLFLFSIVYEILCCELDLELHAAHDHMDLIQNVANSWTEDDFQDTNKLRITCASLCAKCKVPCSSLCDVLGGDVDNKSCDGSDSEEHNRSFPTQIRWSL